MEQLIVFALIVAAISFTVTITSIFKPVRETVAKIHPKLDEWIHCPWCFGHWIAIVILLIPNCAVEIHTCLFLNYFFNLFAIMCLVGLFHYVLLRAYEPVAKLQVMREIEKKKK